MVTTAEQFRKNRETLDEHPVCFLIEIFGRPVLVPAASWLRLVKFAQEHNAAASKDSKETIGAKP